MTAVAAELPTANEALLTNWSSLGVSLEAFRTKSEGFSPQGAVMLGSARAKSPWLRLSMATERWPVLRRVS